MSYIDLAIVICFGIAIILLALKEFPKEGKAKSKESRKVRQSKSLTSNRGPRHNRFFLRRVLIVSNMPIIQLIGIPGLKKPFFTGTYIPKQAKFRRPGLMEILSRN